jgi:N-formylglutamate deformylase
MSDFHFHKGNGPLLVSIPHVGLKIPEEIKADMTDAALSLEDTDWYIERLYKFLHNMDVSIIAADYSRYVVDLNRGADGVSLYPGQKVTEICPTTTFGDVPLYKGGVKPDEKKRIEKYWRPYHDKIRAELDRIKQIHGFARLWDAHSIKSHVPALFDGQLPDLNLGTGDGISAKFSLVEKLNQLVGNSGYTSALNGRFKGGYITRHYGDPDNNIDAVQLEISQITYMDEAPDNRFRKDKADKLRPVLRSLIETMLKS